jgi:hypothetical protein
LISLTARLGEIFWLMSGSSISQARSTTRRFVTYRGQIRNLPGLAYHGKHQYDRAIQDFDQAIRLNPNDA